MPTVNALGVNRMTLLRILDNREALGTVCASQAKGRKRQCSGEHPELEERLEHWLEEARSKTVPIMKVKANEVAAKLGIAGFVANKGWLLRFKLRNRIMHR